MPRAYTTPTMRAEYADKATTLVLIFRARGRFSNFFEAHMSFEACRDKGISPCHNAGGDLWIRVVVVLRR